MTLAKKLLLATGANPYLEFVSSTPMTITPNYDNAGITLQYSLDTVNWVNIVAKAVTQIGRASGRERVSQRG